MSVQWVQSLFYKMKKFRDLKPNNVHAGNTTVRFKMGKGKF